MDGEDYVTIFPNFGENNPLTEETRGWRGFAVDSPNLGDQTGNRIDDLTSSNLRGGQRPGAAQFAFQIWKVKPEGDGEGGAVEGSSFGNRERL